MKYRFVNVHQLRRLVVVKTGKGETARETRKAVVHGYTIICASLRKAHKANLKVKAVSAFYHSPDPPQTDFPCSICATRVGATPGHKAKNLSLATQATMS